MAGGWSHLWQRVREKAPIALMTRGTLEYLFREEFLNELFEDAAVANYSRQFLFSDLVGVVVGVTFATYPSVRRSFLNSPLTQARGTLKCFYEKLNRVEPASMQALVSQSARRVEQILGRRLRSTYAQPIPGHRLLVIDGNHIEATEKRLDGQVAAAQPGQVLALLEHGSGLVRQVQPWEDAHDNEKKVLAQFDLKLRDGDVVVLDRQFCSDPVMSLFDEGPAHFIIRHSASVVLHPLGKRQSRGRSATGRLSEAPVRYGNTMRQLRCVEIALDNPTRNDEDVIRLLTDLPRSQATAWQVAEAYLQRRRIETVFWDLTVALSCEVKALAYPRASLFCFCVAVAVYNGLQAVGGMIAAEHGNEVLEKLSSQVMTEEIGRMWDGLDLAVEERDWRRLRRLTPGAFAQWLKRAASTMDLEYYYKTQRGPKKPKPKRDESIPINAHSSTYRFLKQRKLALNNKTP